MKNDVAVDHPSDASAQPETFEPAPADDLPFAQRRTEDVPGHWLLARLGKTVLRPGGRRLTEAMVASLPAAGHDVVELAPGVGHTARLLLGAQPSSYQGVEEDPAAATITGGVVGDRGTVSIGNAKSTGLPGASADVVVNEAMLTMQTDRSKAQIVQEVSRVLRPGGSYAFHELALTPDGIDPRIATAVRKGLARSIKVNARPLTVAEWTALLTEHGFEVMSVRTAPMALLKLRRIIDDEGWRGTGRIIRNYLRDGEARSRVNDMWRTFHRYRASMIAVAVVARKAAPTGDPGRR